MGDIFKGEKRKLSLKQLEKKAKRITASESSPMPQVIGKQTREELRGGS